MSWIDELESYILENNFDEAILNGLESLVLCNQNNSKVLPSLFSSQTDFTRSAQDFSISLNTRLDPLKPFAGGVYKNFRWHCVIPPCAPFGPIFSLRRARFNTLKISDFLIDSKDLIRIKEGIALGESIIFFGPTGCGKTSLLISLLKEMIFKERVLVLEDISEIGKLNPTWIYLLSSEKNAMGLGGFKLEELFSEALRLRPDRIIIGEIRDRQISCFVNALLSGHNGCLTTFHSGTFDEFKKRFRFLLEKNLKHTSFIAGQKFLAVELKRGTPPQVLGVHEMLL